MDTKNHIIVFCTAPNSETAAVIADDLVKKHLAACVNIIDSVSSVYRWKGDIVRDSECLMIIKTAVELFVDLEAAIKANHPYEVPEIIGFKLEKGNQEYLNWIIDTTRK